MRTRRILSERRTSQTRLLGCVALCLVTPGFHSRLLAGLHPASAHRLRRAAAGQCFRTCPNFSSKIMPRSTVRAFNSTRLDRLDRSVHRWIEPRKRVVLYGSHTRTAGICENSALNPWRPSVAEPHPEVQSCLIWRLQVPVRRLLRWPDSFGRAWRRTRNTFENAEPRACLGPP